MPEIEAPSNGSEIPVISRRDVNKWIDAKLDTITIPSYEEQIKKLTDELNDTRTQLNAANASITELTKKVNEVIVNIEGEIKLLKEPKKSWLDEVVLPE